MTLIQNSSQLKKKSYTKETGCFFFTMRPAYATGIVTNHSCAITDSVLFPMNVESKIQVTNLSIKNKHTGLTYSPLIFRGLTSTCTSPTTLVNFHLIASASNKLATPVALLPSCLRLRWTHGANVHHQLLITWVC